MAKGNFIDYITSDDPNKYPSDGVHTDGYYYKKITKSTGSTTPTEPEPKPTLPKIFVVTKDIPEITNATCDEGMSRFYIGGVAEAFPIIVNDKTYSNCSELNADFSGVYLSTTDTGIGGQPFATFVKRHTTDANLITIYRTSDSNETTIPAFTLVITCVE